MSKLYVGIIYGGMSYEYDISLQSAKNIFHFIDRDRFEVIMIRIDKDGTWYRENVSNKLILFNNILKSVISNVGSYIKDKCCKNVSRSKLCDSWCCYAGSFDPLFKIDVVFPIIHGNGGEDGTLQGFLKMRKIPFVGSGVLGSALSMDKEITKRLLRDSGLLVAPFLTLNNQSSDMLKSFEYCADMLGIPLFIKPANQGSSIGVSKVIDSESFSRAVDLAFNFDHKVLVESAIIGRELECAVLGNNNPVISVFGEIILNDNFYTYYDKYCFPKNVRIVIPAQVSNAISNEIRYIVLRAFHILQCSGMARVDIFLTSDDQVIVNEVNTLPGFTINSMFPRLWEVSGLNFKNLVSKLIDLALEDCREGIN